MKGEPVEYDGALNVEGQLKEYTHVSDRPFVSLSHEQKLFLEVSREGAIVAGAAFVAVVFIVALLRRM